MKKIALVMLGCLLIGGFSALAQPTAADQKWLGVVQKMVEAGKNKISTPSPTRVELAKKWAGEKGLTVTVSKIEAGYQLELSKNIAKN